MYSNTLLTRLLNIIHINTYITYKIYTLILNFNEVLCHSRMNFLLTTNRLSVPPSPPQQVNWFLCHLVCLYGLREGYGVKECLWERTVIFLSVCIEGILQLFTIFYLQRKFSIFLTNDRDCKAVGAPNIFEKQLWL